MVTVAALCIRDWNLATWSPATSQRRRSVRSRTDRTIIPSGSPCSGAPDQLDQAPSRDRSHPDLQWRPDLLALDGRQRHQDQIEILRVDELQARDSDPVRQRPTHQPLRGRVRPGQATVAVDQQYGVRQPLEGGKQLGVVGLRNRERLPIDKISRRHAPPSAQHAAHQAPSGRNRHESSSSQGDHRRRRVGFGGRSGWLARLRLGRRAGRPTGASGRYRCSGTTRAAAPPPAPPPMPARTPPRLVRGTGSCAGSGIVATPRRSGQIR